MRNSRITWEGAFHHVMCRGHEGRALFREKGLKETLRSIVADKSRQLKIRILAYCILDNHYHLVLENSSGRLSEMMKRVNGQFAMAYRKLHPFRGSVFQDRFRSTLIENDGYLRMSIMYALNNPVRAGLARHYSRYTWSSAHELLHDDRVGLTDVEFVLDLFGDREGLIRQMDAFRSDKRIGVKRSTIGEVLGDEGFVETVLRRFDRRKKPDAVMRKRHDDRYFEPLEKVIHEFERSHGIQVERLDLSRWEGKRLRGELLVEIRNRCGLKYSEIAELPLFSGIQLGSLGSLYWHTREKRE